jgi:cytochrome d ubiquinol oxidase subunit II
METLYVPLFLAAVGIVFRGAGYALRGEAASLAEARALGATFAIASVLTPFFFGCAVGAVASGQVPAGGDPTMPISSWTGATALWIGALAVVTSAYNAAVFLAADSVRAQAPDLTAAFRRRALASAALAGAMAIGGLFVIRSDARDLYDGLTSGGGLAMVLVSAAVGLVTLWLVWAGRFELARYTSSIAVGAILAGLAFALRPDFLPGQVSLQEAAADDATLLATLIALVLALLVIVPAMFFLLRLALQGRLSEPLHPIVPADDGGDR